MGGEGEWPSLCIIDGRGGGSGHPCVSLMGGEGEWPSLCIIDGREGGSGHPCVPSGMWHQTRMTKVLAFAVQSLLIPTVN